MLCNIISEVFVNQNYIIVVCIYNTYLEDLKSVVTTLLLLLLLLLLLHRLLKQLFFTRLDFTLWKTGPRQLK